jgi:putative nucleotidyltransferase with HDIG domain
MPNAATVERPRFKEDPRPPWRSPDVTHKSAGRRLLEAFEAFEHFPAFAAARGHVLGGQSESPLGVDAVAAVESDLALTVAVLRKANRDKGRDEQTGSVPVALERIGETGLRALVEGAPSFDFFERSRAWGDAPQAHRLHAVATQRAAARLARAMQYPKTDELLVAALLHDIGKLVLAHADVRYAEIPDPASVTPEGRIERERRALGVDHALVGGVLARRWLLPRELAHAIERHHQPSETGMAGLVRLSDMIARFEAGNAVDTGEMQAAARNVDLDLDALRELLATAPTEQRRSIRPSPLTPGEHRIIRELAKGRVYKEIAMALGLSVSTIRTHLYNIYKKLGVTDRAQAILLAKEHNWI